MCGYRYNTVCNIVYYREDVKNTLFPDSISLQETFKEHTANLFYNYTPAEYYRIMIDPNEGPIQESKKRDKFELMLRIINLRDVILHAWVTTYNNHQDLFNLSENSILEEKEFDVNFELRFGNLEQDSANDSPRSRFIWDETLTPGDYFALKENNAERSRKKSRFTFKPKNVKEEKINPELLLLTDSTKFNLFKKGCVLATLDSYMLMKVLFFLNAIYLMLILVLKSLTLAFHYISNSIFLSCNIYSHLKWRAESLRDVAQIFRELHEKEPDEISKIMKKLLRIYSVLLLTILDIILGVFFYLIVINNYSALQAASDSILGIISTEYMKKYAFGLAHMPLGMKLDKKYSYFIAKLMNILFSFMYTSSFN